VKRAIDQLGKRERQIAELVIRMGKAGAEEVRQAIPDPPAYSSVRTVLNILVRKGFLRLSRSGRRYLYQPAGDPAETKRHALRSVVRTYFNDSVEEAVSGLLSSAEARLTDEDYARLMAMIRRARKERTQR